MKLRAFLSEALSFDEKSHILKKECEPFLSTIKNKDYELYRGMWADDVPKTFTSIPVIQNRVPKNTPKVIHELYDTAFYSVFGKKLRSSSVFCTGNQDQSEVYGDTYLILPVGNFNCYWSPIINDLFLFDYREQLLDLNKNSNKDVISFIIYAFLMKLKINNDSIKYDMAIVRKFNELINKSVRTTMDINNVLAEYTPAIIEKISTGFIKAYYKKDNLKKAIDSGNEIMLSCDSYYALDVLTNQKLWDSLFK